MGYFAPREAETTLACPKCGRPLDIVRSCREAHMRCNHCRSTFPLKDFVNKMDEAMEEFLNRCYIDRI